MIKLSNGHSLEYVVASGALGFDGQGWPWEKPLVKLGFIKPELFSVVIKSLTRFPTKGNLRWSHPWSCVRLLPNGGAVNKIGLTNPGIDWWCNTIGLELNYKKFPIVMSIFGEGKDLVEMAQMANDFDFVAIEVNVSCPNHKHAEETQKIIQDIRAVKAVSRHPIILKLSVSQKYVDIAKGLVGVVEAISLNSVPWAMAFHNGYKTPLWKLEQKVGGGGGGVSGIPAQELNWKAVEEIAKEKTIPIIAPSIMEFGDLAYVRILGASAVSFGAIHLRSPWKPTRFVRKDMQRHGN